MLESMKASDFYIEGEIKKETGGEESVFNTAVKRIEGVGGEGWGRLKKRPAARVHRR